MGDLGVCFRSMELLLAYRFVQYILCVGAGLGRECVWGDVQGKTIALMGIS